MRYTLAFVLAVLTPLCALAQAREPWLRFERRGTGAFGFKDSKGNTVVAPTLYRVIADTFHHIIAVQDTSFNGYYLLRDGRTAGKDSLYTFELEPDCESEGLIRFRNPATGKVGFLDTGGRVVIAAIYDYAEPFFNGFAIAHRNGHLECADKDTANCEHHVWAGGEQILINPRNEVLVAGPGRLPRSINWYAAARNAPSPDTPRFITFRGTDNGRLSFVNYEWEFAQWLQHRFLPALRAPDSSLAPLVFAELITASKRSSWRRLNREAFLRRYPQKRLAHLLSDAAMQHSAIMDDALNPYLYNGARFRRYFTSCARPFQERYPSFLLTVDRQRAGSDAGEQDQFTFLRTESGYKLVGLNLAD